MIQVNRVTTALPWDDWEMKVRMQQCGYTQESELLRLCIKVMTSIPSPMRHFDVIELTVVMTPRAAFRT